MGVRKSVFESKGDQQEAAGEHEETQDLDAALKGPDVSGRCHGKGGQPAPEDDTGGGHRAGEEGPFARRRQTGDGHQPNGEEDEGKNGLQEECSNQQEEALRETDAQCAEAGEKGGDEEHLLWPVAVHQEPDEEGGYHTAHPGGPQDGVRGTLSERFVQRGELGH